MGYSGPTHQVGTFFGRVDDLHTEGILQVLYTGDSTVEWSSSLHSIGSGSSVYRSVHEEFLEGHGDTTVGEYRFSSSDKWLSERTIQILEDMLRACVLDLKGSWEEHLPLVEFTYNNSYQASIQMVPYEALYGRPCRSPICWTEVGESSIIGPYLIKDTSDKVGMIRKRLLTPLRRQKSYADVRRRPLEFKVGDHVFLKVMPKRGVIRFGKRGKMSPRYIGPFEVLERVGTFAYRLVLPPSLSSVHEVFHVSML